MRKQTGRRARRARRARRQREAATDGQQGPVVEEMGQGARWVRAADRARTKRQAAARAENKRSSYVTFGIVGAVVLACCGTSAYQQFFQKRRCIDPRTQQIIENTYCRNGGSGGTVGRWYYGGRGGSRVGETVSGGSFERGGFGRFFKGGG